MRRVHVRQVGDKWHVTNERDAYAFFRDWHRHGLRVALNNAALLLTHRNAKIISE